MEAQISFQAMATAPRSFTMKEVVDVKGQPVNVEKLASDYLLIVITFKDVECQLCVQLLEFLNLYGLEPAMTEYYDPVEDRTYVRQPEKEKLFKLLLTKDAYFIIVCPGREEQVAELQRRVPFTHFPFIGGEQAMRLGRELRVTISDTELRRAVLTIAPSTLNTSIIKLGLSGGDKSHQILIKYLLDRRIPVERKGAVYVEETRRAIEKLKLKATKCRQCRLATTTLSLTLRHNAPRSPIPTPIDPSVQNQKWNVLPLEILQLILSFIPKTQHIASAARVSRRFYIAYCNVLIERLREKSTKVRQGLPEDIEQLNEPGGGYKDIGRWWHYPYGIGLRELERRVGDLERLLHETPGDIRPSLRRKLGASSMGHALYLPL